MFTRLQHSRSMIILILLYIMTLTQQEAPGPHLSPFFFLCNYHSKSQNYGLDEGEVILSVHIQGNPPGYVPGNFYQISISSSETFDNFLMTGLYTTSVPSSASKGLSLNPGGQNLMCSIIHSQVSPRPMRSLMFVWMAPPTGTGCINFLATATHGQQLLFKDTSVMQFCEQGTMKSESMKPKLAEIHSDSIVFRDDFDSEDSFDPDLWSQTDGGQIRDDCGIVANGKAIFFCDSVQSRNLVTVPLNLTSAHILQFSIGGGKCGPNKMTDQDIVIAYGTERCTKWQEIERIKVPQTSRPRVHIISLPLASRHEDICIQFNQALDPLIDHNILSAVNIRSTRTAFLQNTFVAETRIFSISNITPSPVTKPSLSSTSSYSSTFDEVLTAATTSSQEMLTTSLSLSLISTGTIKTDPSASISAAYMSTTESTQSSSSTESLIIQPLSSTTLNTLETYTSQITSSSSTTQSFINQSTEGIASTVTLKTESEHQSTMFLYKNASTLPEEVYIEPNDQPFNDEPFPDQLTNFYHSCWGLDNVVVVNLAQLPNKIQDNFDPIHLDNWIFFPGAQIENQCLSNGNALLFNNKNQTSVFALTRDLDLDLVNVQIEAHLFVNFSENLSSLKVESGQIGTVCGDIHSGKYLIFDGSKNRQVCTALFSPKEISAVRFKFQFGGDYCHSNSSSPHVLMYLEDEKGQTHVLKNLEARYYQTNQVISSPIHYSASQKHFQGRMKFCLLQKSHGGKNKDVWSVDDLALLPLLPNESTKDYNKVFQLSVNLECEEKVSEKTSIGIEYSTDYGVSWNEFYTSCLPSTCTGYYQSLSSIVSAKQFSGWNRITLPIPIAAQSSHTRFRIIHLGTLPASWAFDDVFIGECEKWCSGHGYCLETGCSCDFGYEGDHCDQPVLPALSSFQENFEDPLVISSSSIIDINGASVGYECSVVSSGKALVFNKAGSRSLKTAEINTTKISSLQFTLRIGSMSVTSSCPPPDAPWEDIILEFSCNGGISWKLLKELSSLEFKKPKSTSITLPVDARRNLCHFRWRQPQHSGSSKDVWAIDDIIFSPEAMSSLLSAEMMDISDLEDRLSTNQGKLVHSFCGQMSSIVFSNKTKNGEPRTLMTKDMRVGPGYIAQFSLVMGCGIPYAKGLDNAIYFQYSVDHGITWHLVEESCLPPNICDTIRSGTIYTHSKFNKWDRVTIILAQDIWSQQTKFRWLQPDWSESDVWSIHRLYIGYPCQDLCHGFGTCHNGLCSCDKGYIGETCTPEYELDSSIQADFGHRYSPQKDFTIRGGNVVYPDDGCGLIVSGENMYFFKDGARELFTKVLNTQSNDFIQFYIKIGGNSPNCNGADKRNESVLFSYTTNGGILWTLLKELHHMEQRKPNFIHLTLPVQSKSPHTQFKWWQPSHSGSGQDQWAVDEILIGHYRKFTTLQDDFDNTLEPMQSDQWRTITEGVIGKYCRQTNPSLVMSNQVNDKFAVTNDVRLQPGDVIQFEINVGCVKQFKWDYPVIFEYSHDHGKSWSLVEEPCYLDQDCDGTLTEGSVYHTGTYGQWTLIIIKVTDKIAMHPAIFRWLQTGGVDHSFSIDNLYMGPPCAHNCHRQGVCQNGRCKCLQNLVDVVDENCGSTNVVPSGMLDRFDNQNMPSMTFWDRILGGHLSKDCGKVDSENALYFGGDGTREAVTLPLNTTDKKILEFYIKIGDSWNTEKCHQPRDRNEGVIVDFSTDNGISWQILKIVEPAFEDIQSNSIIIDLPSNARKERVIFRFWQPLGLGEMQRAEWAIDSVLVGVNETSPLGFEDTFSGSNIYPDPDHWFLADSAIQRETCSSKDNALEFNNKKDTQLAETWDYQITPSTFLQFDLAMNCGALSGNPYSIRLEYSTDHGHTWTSVVNDCLPPNFECLGYHSSSTYPSDQFSNWTRITVALPEKAITSSTRFRWLRPYAEKNGAIWAIDNVYLGDTCPWLCSGHGFCQKGTCQCDPGFGGEYCVPLLPLPMVLKDDFNSDQVNNFIWNEVYGGSNSDLCGPVINGRSFTFDKDGFRMAMTVDMDSSMLTSMEFSFKYGCGSEELFWPRNESVLLQYSINGGITWKLLKEIHFSNTSQPRFYSLPLPIETRNNATRFRFWQAANNKKMLSVWSVDNLFIGTMISSPNSIYESFDAEKPDPMSWIFVNDGTVDVFCPDKRNQPFGNTALVFHHSGQGELSAITADIEIGPMSIVQFDINIGCGADASSKFPVRLEYSADGGLSWSLVGVNCALNPPAGCFESSLPASIYYAGDSINWQRVILPLNHLHICGNVRFRWYQGTIPDDDFGPEWAIDNVFIGMACQDHCNGHGYCLGGIACQCDEGYTRDTCVLQEPNPVYLKDDFNSEDSSKPEDKIILPALNSDDWKSINEKNWKYWSGGQVSSRHECGKIFTEASFIQSKSGHRVLTSVPLDLSKANVIQFYLKLGCKKVVNRMAEPVFLQYSTSGGIYWKTIEQFDFNPDSNQPKYIVVHIPAGAQTNSSLVRWWQPTKDGYYEEDWAIDQIYIGGNMYGEVILQDDPNIPLNSTWLEHPGARYEAVCGSDGSVLHFRDQEKHRFASTADVMVGDQSILQFELLMECDKNKGKIQQCFELNAEYSLNMGKSWNLLKPACLPSNVVCGNYHSGSIYISDLFSGWYRVTVTVPKHAWSSQTRFRLRQLPDYAPGQDWAIQQLYIGSTCPNKCQGHGRCKEKQCVCDTDWQGDDCSKPKHTLSKIIVEDFLDGFNQSNWARVVGAFVKKPCRLLSAGDALHFTGVCSRLIETHPLDLSDAMFIQFYFLYGCISQPVKREQGVLLEYSIDGGINWQHITEMHYNLFRTPRFISIKIPDKAKKQGTQLRWWQPQHEKTKDYDWLIDSIRVNGEEINPPHLTINFTAGFEYLDLISADNMEVGKYCGKHGVAIGKTKSYEPSVLSSREVQLSADQHILQFSINVGCDKSWNFTTQPVNVEYSTDHGMTWVDLVTNCLEESTCLPYSHLAANHYHGLHNNWRRIVLPLRGLSVSNGTRFRWQQLPDGLHNSQDWALADIYIGPSCPNNCNGHGFCFMKKCVCDVDYGGTDCAILSSSRNLKSLKDTFDGKVNITKWPWIQEGNIQTPCMMLVDEKALVFNGPGARELVSANLDLRDARFIQYTAFMWSKIGQAKECGQPPDHESQNVYLQFSTDGGIDWSTLHKLSPRRYWPPKTDYISLPTTARSSNSQIRWIQAESPALTSPRVNWAIDDVFIGGWEINPSEYHQSFDEDEYANDDSSAWEFSPSGVIHSSGTDSCSLEGYKGSSIVWANNNTSVKKFTTNQMIIQAGYMLQFKLIIGCGKYSDICAAPKSLIKLEYRRNPSSDLWEAVQPSCLPSSQSGGLCNPHNHHHASHYSMSQFLTWTRITLALSEVTFSSSTQFRWIYEGGHNQFLPWALDDIYIGEKCQDMCNGRGDCIKGVCHCDPGYLGPTCLTHQVNLPSHILESFEGGIFTSRWQRVSGGGIGFGCGALLPHAHGKTLYFNGCGERQAITAELDTSYAIKIIFVIQIGCIAQTINCNVLVGDGPNYRGVLLQYSKNKGITWYLISQHDAADYLKPKRVAYDIPAAAKDVGTQFRWWQPVHAGHGFDQWAIDHVEIISRRRRSKN